jgi:hypothetical protein
MAEVAMSARRARNKQQILAWIGVIAVIFLVGEFFTGAAFAQGAGPDKYAPCPNCGGGGGGGGGGGNPPPPW